MTDEIAWGAPVPLSIENERTWRLGEHDGWNTRAVYVTAYDKRFRHIYVEVQQTELSIEQVKQLIQVLSDAVAYAEGTADV